MAAVLLAVVDAFCAINICSFSEFTVYMHLHYFWFCSGKKQLKNQLNAVNRTITTGNITTPTFYFLFNWTTP